MANYYNWFKAIHIIALISWMAGMLYLPRLFVYHAQNTNKETQDTFKIMQHRLIKFIINPAMIVTIFFGLILAHIYGWHNLGIAFCIKMSCVFLLLLLHGLMIKWHKKFLNNTNTNSPTFYKIINESITALMVICVIMVVIKPFQ